MKRFHAGCSIYHGDQGVLDAIDKIRELAGQFNVREVCFDPRRFSQGAQELEAEGIAVTVFPQSDARMLPASDRLYRSVIEQRLTLPDNPELRAHAHAAIARHSRRGWRIDKAQRCDNIDAVIAMCMALRSSGEQARRLRVARMALARRCLGCQRRTRNGSYCPHCWHTRRRIRTGWEWGAIRARVQERERDGVCVRCGSTRRLHVHHRIPLRYGGGNDIGNLELLCARCHDQ